MAQTDEGKRIGRRVAQIREARAWDQSELARRAGVLPSYINRLESGQYGRPSAERLTQLARALGVQLTDLTEPVPADAGIRGQLAAMGLDLETEAQLAAEILADLATLPPGRERLDTLRALRTLIRPRPAHRP